MRRLVTRRIQYLIVFLSHFFCNLCLVKNKNDSWVVVGVETAAMLKNISQALPQAISVNFKPHRFYDFKYNHQIYTTNKLSRLKNDFISALLLGYLMSRYNRFLYIGEASFLIKNKDGRAKEFALLKSKDKMLACYFLGSEIRSFNLLGEYAKQNNIDVLTTYQSISQPGINSEKKERLRKKLAKTANKYADFIFNPAMDQMTYIDRKTHPMIYFLGHDAFYQGLNKFDELKEIIILHGPSSPLIKGTPLVRAAIKKLQEEGYRFKYLEMIEVSHSELLDALQSAHIVLNQFYAFLPGVFGMEAMASSCVLLTSADETIETSLDEGANEAWIVTPYWNIYDNLKMLLDNPDLMKPQAKAGYDWALKNCSYDAGAKKLNHIVNA